MLLTVLNDIHSGALRSAGTTEASKWALRRHIDSELLRLLPASGDLMLLGDLFDTNNVPIYDVLRVYETLSHWLTSNPGSSLFNVAGNHDLNRVSNVLSSFQFLGRLLYRQFPDRYVHIESPTMTPYGYVIPHLRNQDLFDLALKEVPECENLFLHVNYDNHFAAQSDQSLNLSKEQAEAAQVQNIVIAHEHHTRKSGKVVIPGNQIASSVSDWLAGSDKYYTTVSKLGVQLQLAAKRSDQFEEVTWENVADATKPFIRVSGTVEPEDLQKVLSAINKFRTTSDALVITNGVTTKTDESIAEVFSSSLENVQKFSVTSALKAIFTPEEFKIVEPYLC